MRWLVLLTLACPLLALEPELAAMVDQPTPAKRKNAALKLAKLGEFKVDDWLQAMRRFWPRREAEPGARTEVVALLVEGKVEQTEITVFVPESYTQKRPAAMLLALHGAGADGRDEHRRWQGVAEELGMIVLAPSESGENAGYAFTRRERTASLQALRWARRRFNIDENRIHLTGISRGGHMTWDVGLRHPDLFASLSPMIGGPRLDTRAGQNNLRYVENIRHLPVRDLQGEGDDPRMLFNLRYAFKVLERLGAKDAELITFPGLAHSFDLAAVDWKAFFGGAAREPRPDRVVRLAVDPKEGRAHWAAILAVERDVKESFTPKVRAEEWNALDDAGRRRTIAAAALRRTARLEVAMEAPGVFLAKSRGVRRFRLLLARGMFDPTRPVTVTWNGKTRSKRIQESKRVLLLDFAERFDRRYLPVAEISLP
jgi:predicted esterase